MAKHLVPVPEVEVRFLCDYTTKEADPVSYHKGERLRLNARSAMYFLGLSVVEVIEGETSAEDEQEDASDKPKRGRPKKGE